MSPASDPRGGLFIDSGDGRGPIHTDDMTDAERATHGLPPRSVEPAPIAEAPVDEAPAIPALTSTEDVTDGR